MRTVLLAILFLPLTSFGQNDEVLTIGDPFNSVTRTFQFSTSSAVTITTIGKDCQAILNKGTPTETNIVPVRGETVVVWTTMATIQGASSGPTLTATTPLLFMTGVSSVLCTCEAGSHLTLVAVKRP